MPYIFVLFLQKPFDKFLGLSRKLSFLDFCSKNENWGKDKEIKKENCGELKEEQCNLTN